VNPLAGLGFAGHFGRRIKIHHRVAQADQRQPNGERQYPARGADHRETALLFG
jgi:hypothetical protein